MTGLRVGMALIAAVLGAALTFSLGQWQLRRAAEKLALEARWVQAEQAGARAADADALRRLAPADLPVRVRVRGQFDARHAVWLDNRQHDGRPGFWAVMPLRMADGSAVLVNRGWAPRDVRDRTRVPELPAAPGEIEFEALAIERIPRLLDLDESGARAPLPGIWQNVEREAFTRATGLALVGVDLQQVTGPGDGLVRDWARPASGVDRHRGYAVQWFGLSALIVLLTVLLGLRAWRSRRDA